MEQSMKMAGMALESGEKRAGWLKVSDWGALSVEMPVTVLRGVEEGPRLAVIAGIHGCEYTGIEASIRLGRDLDPKDMRGTLGIVHVVNVPAFQSRTQYVCPLDGLNLSDIRPGKPDGTISHRILHKVYTEVVFQADACMDLHAGDLYEALSVPFIIYTVTEDARSNEMTMLMAEAHGAGYIWGMRGEGVKPGGPGSAGCPIPYIAVECGQEGRMEETYVRTHYQGVLNVMTALGMLNNGRGDGKRKDVIRLRTGGKIRSDTGGIFYSFVKTSDRAAKGDLIGEIRDIRGAVLQRIFTPVHCMILMYVSNPVVGPGDVLFGYGEL